MSTLKRFEFEELEARLKAALAARVRRLGYLGEFFKCAAHQPEALLAFIDFTEKSKGGLPERLVEVVALTVAQWMGNDYERNQHERLSIRLGFDRDWIRAVIALTPSESDQMTEVERLVQQMALKVLDTRGNGAAATFEKLAESIGDEQAIAVLMVLGRYVVHGLFVNTLGLKAPVPSIFEDGFQ